MRASWQLVNEVEICQLFSEFAIRLRVTSNVDEYFAHRSENLINLSLFVYIFRRIIYAPVDDNSLFTAFTSLKKIYFTQFVVIFPFESTKNINNV